jgi:hypothetical protein
VKTHTLSPMASTVRLLEATLELRVDPGSGEAYDLPVPRVDCDFRLTMDTPAGRQTWGSGFAGQDVGVDGLTRKTDARAYYHRQIESLFEDLLDDLREHGWLADKSLDDLDVSVTIPDAVYEVAERTGRLRPPRR